VFGPETQDAIRSFQARRGLPVTGQVDSRLIRALQS
jgi:peptidoglycan hydrolase-like protein with peptidoglycan-binding domain